MPFYEYQCQACGAQVEVLQKISDAPLKKCPECGKSKLVKLISAPVFRLKGSGWYETDFKSDKENKRNLVETEKGEGKTDEAKSDTKTDSKADAKPEGKPGDKPAAASEGKPAAPAASASKSRPVSRAAKAPARPAPRKAPVRSGTTKTAKKKKR